jgi:hypothetical protein
MELYLFFVFAFIFFAGIAAIKQVIKGWRSK